MIASISFALIRLTDFTLALRLLFKLVVVNRKKLIRLMLCTPWSVSFATKLLIDTKYELGDEKIEKKNSIVAGVDVVVVIFRNNFISCHFTPLRNRLQAKKWRKSIFTQLQKQSRFEQMWRCWWWWRRWWLWHVNRRTPCPAYTHKNWMFCCWLSHFWYVMIRNLSLVHELFAWQVSKNLI